MYIYEMWKHWYQIHETLCIEDLHGGACLIFQKFFKEAYETPDKYVYQTEKYQEPYENFLMDEKLDDHEERLDLTHELLTLHNMDFRFQEEGQQSSHEDLNQLECLSHFINVANSNRAT